MASQLASRLNGAVAEAGVLVLKRHSVELKLHLPKEKKGAGEVSLGWEIEGVG